MKTINTILKFTLAQFLIINLAFSQQIQTTFVSSEEEPSIGDELAKLDWLSGQWIGDGFDGTSEEIWTRQAFGSMMGMFRFIKENKVVFYEFMTITEIDGELALRLKHFTPKMIGWEEKDDHITFPFVKADENQFEFEGLIFKRISNNQMQILLTLKTEDGHTKVEEFNMARRSP